MKLWFVCLLLVPAALRAQTRVTLTPFVASDETMAGDPLGIGMSMAARSGLLGVRVGGRAMPTWNSDPGITTSSQYLRGWAADADLLFAPAGASGFFLGFAPIVYAGIGARSELHATGEGDVTPTWSYGGDILYHLGDHVSLETGARHRAGLRTDPFNTTMQGWEYRFGLAFHFGGRRSSSMAMSSKGSGTYPSRGTAPRVRSAGSSAALGHAVIATGENYLGTRYVYGGESPSGGFDCSGFVQYVFRKNGVELPRTSRQQAVVGLALPTEIDAFAPGDLIFFSEGTRISHVAIYAGSNRILHATSSGGQVRYDDLQSQRGRWYATHMVAARRMSGRSDWTQFLQHLIPQFDGFDAGDRAPPVRSR